MFRGGLGFPSGMTVIEAVKKKEPGGRPVPEDRKKERGIGTHINAAAGATGRN